jgi:hypothetical protein
MVNFRAKSNAGRVATLNDAWADSGLFRCFIACLEVPHSCGREIALLPDHAEILSTVMAP